MIMNLFKLILWMVMNQIMHERDAFGLDLTLDIIWPEINQILTKFVQSFCWTQPWEESSKLPITCLITSLLYLRAHVHMSLENISESNLNSSPLGEISITGEKKKYRRNRKCEERNVTQRSLLENKDLLWDPVDQLQAVMNEALQKYWPFQQGQCMFCCDCKRNFNSASRNWNRLLWGWRRRRKTTEGMRGDGRMELKGFGEKRRGVRTVPEPRLRLGLLKERQRECSLWIAVMGAGSLWTAGRELQPSIDPADW